MCVYCERRQDVKHGWEQPALYGKEYPEDSTGGKIHSNLNVDGEPDWEAHIYDYQTKTPELVLTSKRFAEDIWGDGVASIHVPIRFCPVCGRKLGEKQKEKGTKKYCIYNGKVWDAKKIRDRIKITTDYEFPGLDKVVDEYGKEVWQKYIQTEECEDYYEIFPKIIIDGEKVDISLSVGKNWVIETADDKIAHKLNMMEVDRNFWSRVLTTEEFTEAQFEVVYKHLDDKLDKSVLMDVSAFLKLFYDM